MVERAVTVTVAVPFYGDRDMLRRCVRSILDQTHRDLRVLVIADGMKTGLRYRDSRLDVYELSENRGAYYARAVALAATDTEHHAVIDADDWVEPEWIETLLAADRAVVWQRSWWEYREDGQRRCIIMNRAAASASPRFLHTTSHTGLYRTATLQAVGGYHPGYRFGWDTLLVGLLRMTAPFAAIDQPLYHRTRLPESLTRHPSTAIRSPQREAARQHLRGLHLRAWHLREDPPSIRRMITSTIPLEMAAEIDAHASKIRNR